MAGIVIKHKGDLHKTHSFLERAKSAIIHANLENFAAAGVSALASATPVDSGKTASSWSYEITRNNSGVKIVWKNDNINKGVPIAIILQYGHGTGTGGYVEGRDYINPAIQPIMDKIAEGVWEEVTKI